MDLLLAGIAGVLIQDLISRARARRVARRFERRMDEFASTIKPFVDIDAWFESLDLVRIS